MKDSINGGQQGVRVDLNNSGQIAGLVQAKQQELNGVILGLREALDGGHEVEGVRVLLTIVESQALVLLSLSALHAQKATAVERIRQQRIVPPIVFPGR